VTTHASLHTRMSDSRRKGNLIRGLAKDLGDPRSV